MEKCIYTVKNSYIKYLRNLKKNQFDKHEGKVLIEGIRLIEEAFKTGVTVESFLYEERLKESLRGWNLYKKAFQNEVKIIKVTGEIINQLADTQSPQGVMAVVDLPLPPREFINNDGLLVLVDGVRDPGNLGTIIRTAEAAGCTEVVITGGTVHPYNPKVLRATMGSVFRLPVIKVPEITQYIKDLKNCGTKIVVGEVEANRFYFETDLRGPVAIVLGHETEGVSHSIRALADERVKIPLAKEVESLNVAVAAGILLYEAVRQRIGE